MSNLLTYIQSQTKPKYTDLQQSAAKHLKTVQINHPVQDKHTKKPTIQRWQSGQIILT